MKTLALLPLLAFLTLGVGCKEKQATLNVSQYLNSPGSYANQTHTVKVAIDSQITSNTESSVLIVRDLATNLPFPVVKPSTISTTMLPEQRFMLTVKTVGTNLVLVNASKL